MALGKENGMKIRQFRLVFLFCAMAILFSSFAPFGIQQALILPPDPEGESTVAYTLQNASGNPSGVIDSAGYVLDDGSVVVNAEGIASTNQVATYELDVNLDTNTYSLIQTENSPTVPPPSFAGSVALYTREIATRRMQVKTTNVLHWRVVNGTVGYLSHTDRYQLLPTSTTGGLSWSILKSPQNPPYTTSPVNANLINDTGNGKYKNFNYGDPNLSTVAVHFITLQKHNVDADNVYRWNVSHKMKNEGKREFQGVVDLNQDIN